MESPYEMQYGRNPRMRQLQLYFAGATCEFGLERTARISDARDLPKHRSVDVSPKQGQDFLLDTPAYTAHPRSCYIESTTDGQPLVQWRERGS